MYDDAVKIGSICTGIGGLDMAAEHVFNAHVDWVCDFNDDSTHVLDVRYPGVRNFRDVTGVRRVDDGVSSGLGYWDRYWFVGF